MQTRKRTDITTTIARFMVPEIKRRKETSTQRKRRLKKAKNKREEKKALKKLEEQWRLDALRFQNDLDPLGVMEIKGQVLQEQITIKLEEESMLDSKIVKQESHLSGNKLERSEFPENHDSDEIQTQAEEKQGVLGDDMVFGTPMVQIKQEYDQDESNGITEPQKCDYNQVFLPEVKLEPQFDGM